MNNLYKPFFVFASAIYLFASCGSDSKEAMQKELADLRAEQAEINSKIAALEKEVGPAINTAQEGRNKKHVSVQPLTAQDFTHYIEVNGRVESDKNIVVSARAAGYITKVNVTRGQRVGKGQVLATIDAQMVLSGIEELKSGLSLATTIYEKQKKLWDQQIGTEVQYLQAKNAKESLEKKLVSANDQYDMAVIRSTINGTVDDVMIKEGETVAPGVPAFRVIGGRDYKVTAEIPETYISRVTQKGEVEIVLPDLNQTYKSKISNVSSTIGTSNRTFLVEAPLTGVSDAVKANMLAQIKIKDYTKPAAVVVPINVVQHGDTGDYLFVADGNKAKRKQVQIGQTYKSNAEVLEGLGKGEKLITVGYLELVDGQEIQY